MKKDRAESEELIPRLDLKQLDLMANDMVEIKNLLQNSLEEEPEIEPQVSFLQEIVKILSEEIASAKQMDEIELRKEISIIAHLNFLEEMLLDVIGPSMEDDLFEDEFDDCCEHEMENCCGDEKDEECQIVPLNVFKK